MDEGFLILTSHWNVIEGDSQLEIWACDDTILVAVIDLELKDIAKYICNIHNENV